jgi:hypothetical protein
VRHYKKVKEEREVVSHILCNICGKNMITECSKYGNGVLVEYQGGYDSEYIGDGKKVSLDVCEECLYKKIISMCQSVPVNID